MLMPRNLLKTFSSAQEQILGDRHRWNEAGLLEHHGDAHLLGVMRGAGLGKLAFYVKRSGTRMNDAGHDLGQRRLPGSILAEQGMNLTTPQAD